MPDIVPFVHDVGRSVTSAAVDDNTVGVAEYSRAALFFEFGTVAPDSSGDEEANTVAGTDGVEGHGGVSSG